jgi:hypothetical protein
MKKLNTPTDVFPGKKLLPGGLFPAITTVGHHSFLPYLFKVTAVLEKSVGDFINEAINVLKPAFSYLNKLNQ